jgi:hypothetical protein
VAPIAVAGIILTIIGKRHPASTRAKIRAHLREVRRPRQPAQRTESTPRRLPSGAASQAGPFSSLELGRSDRLLALPKASSPWAHC